MKINRFSAINGKLIDPSDSKYDKYLINNNIKNYHNIDMKEHFIKNHNKRIGHFGCYLSHIEVLQKFLKTKNKFLIIFEDDALLINDFKNVLIERTKYVPSNWDIILLGFKFAKINNNDPNKDLHIINGVTKVNSYTGNYSVIYNRKSAKKLLKLLIPMDWYMDWHMTYLSIDNKINIYGLIHPLVCIPGKWNIKNNLYEFNYNNKIELFDYSNTTL